METNAPRILIVDDDPTTLAVIGGTLRREGYEVTEAMDGLAAIARLETAGVSAVVLDILMPGLDGFGVLHHLSQHFPDLRERVVVVTSLADEELGATIHGVFRVLPKPLDRKLLVDTVHAALQVPVF